MGTTVLLAAAVALLPVVPADAAEMARLEGTTLDQQAVDIVYDRGRNLVFASVPATASTRADQIVALDPATGAVRRSVVLGGDPGAIALSDDGTALYVGLRGRNELVRLDPGNLTVVSRTALHYIGPSSAPVYAGDIEVQPGNADLVVATLVHTADGGGRHGGVVAVDRGVVRPAAVPAGEGPTDLTRGPDPRTFYGVDNTTSNEPFSTLTLAADGVSVTDEIPDLVGGDIEYHDGLVYTSQGAVLDPIGKVVVSRYPNSGAVEPVASRDRTYILTPDDLLTHQRTTLRLIDRTSAYSGAIETEPRLVAAGAGLVAVDQSGGIHLFRPVPLPAAPVFSDIAGHAHADNIRLIAQAQIASGYADGTFRPDTPVTRGQMASFLSRSLPLRSGGSNGFIDVEDSVHEGPINAIRGARITFGYPDSTFRPDEYVTREQMATFLTRAFELPAASGPAPFTDVSGVHAGAVAALAESGVTEGTGGGRFSPGQPVTRGQMASFLIRSLVLTDGLPNANP